MKNNKLLKGFVILFSAIILTVGTIAASGSENVDIFFRNIKIMIDGAEYVPTNANGEVVEPFIMDGTTYLPVRAVANAFDKDVKWDGKNAVVYLGKEGRMEPDNRLDKLQYNMYVEGSERNDFTIINGKLTDVNNDIYTNGIMLFLSHAFSDYIVEDDEDEADSIVGYPLNGQYDSLSGRIVIPKEYDIASWGKKDDCRRRMVSAWIYGDDELLFSATGINDSMPFKFDVDVRGVNQITIKVKSEGDCHVALTDLALYE